jgi:hypothetical protein
MHLVHGLARRVEELQAVANAVAVALFDSKSMRPDAREDPEVDLLAQHQRVHPAGDDLVVDADLLVHGAFVAGQRHHLADRLQAGQHVVDARRNPQRSLAAPRRDVLRFRDAEFCREVALAQRRMLLPRAAYVGRREPFDRRHSFAPTC